MSPPAYINAKDVPTVYGIPEGTVQWLVRRRLVPFSRPIRGTVLFRRRDIEQWIQEGRVEPLEERA